MPLNECLNEYESPGKKGKKGKKVTLVIWKASLGGIEKTLIDYFEYLKDDINFTIYSLRKVDRKESWFSGYRVNFRCGHNWNMILYSKFLLYALINRNQIFHLFNAGPIILLILRLTSVKKVIYHIHGTIYWKKFQEKIIRKISWYLALNKINSKIFFLSNSEFSKKRFQEQISSKTNIEVLYNPFDVTKFTPVAKPRSHKLRIFYVGRLVKGKNLFLWVDAAEQILKYFPQARFKIGGIGNLMDELSERIREKGLENSVEILGYLEDVEKIYQENDLLLFLSEYESFGNVAVESVLTNTPVIVSTIPSMKEIFRDYPEFLVELDTHIFDSIINKLKNYDSLMESVSRARNDFIEKFNVENHIGRIKELYQEMEKQM